MPLPILAAASLISGGISALQGAAQKKKAAKLAEQNPFPDQQVPQAILENKALAQQFSNVGLPSEQYQKAQVDIQRNANRTISSATDRRAGLGTIGAVQQGSNDATNNLNVADANARRQNQQQLYGINSQLGQFQNNAWDWNKRQKYMQTAASARSLMGAGNANIFGGLDRALGGLLQSGIGGGAKATSTTSPNGTGVRQQGTFGQPITNSIAKSTMPSAPQSFNAGTNSLNSIMQGGMMLGTKQVPSQGASISNQFVPKNYNNFDWIKGQ